MFKTQVHQSHTPPTFFLLNKPCIPGPGTASFSVRPRPEFRKKYRNVRVGYVPANIKAVASDTDTRKSVSVKATVTVKLTVGGFLSSLIGLSHGLDDVSDWLGKTLLLEVVSSEVDPSKYFTIPKFYTIGWCWFHTSIFRAIDNAEKTKHFSTYSFLYQMLFRLFVRTVKSTD